MFQSTDHKILSVYVSIPSRFMDATQRDVRNATVFPLSPVSMLVLVDYTMMTIRQSLSQERREKEQEDRLTPSGCLKVT